MMIPEEIIIDQSESSFDIDLPNMIPLSSIQQIHVFLMMLADYCAQQSCLHDISLARYKRLNYMIAIPAILLSTVSGASALANISNHVCSDSDVIQKWLGFTFGFMSLVAACLFSIHRFANIAELKEQHDFFSDEFEKMNLDIRSNIILDNTNTNRCFSNLYEYLKYCKYELAILIDHAPPISKRTKMRFFKQKHAIDIAHFLKT